MSVRPLPSDDECILRACLELLEGQDAQPLPLEVMRYVVGDVDELPADLGWVPEALRPLLQVLREVVKDHIGQATWNAALMEVRAAEEAWTVIHRAARASRQQA